ncbi:MAG: glycosyltransferase [Phocaeicola coprocola]
MHRDYHRVDFPRPKAQWRLIKAFSIYRQQTNEKVELVLMGHGEYTEELKKLAEKLHISAHTHFLPFNINPYKYYDTCAYLFAYRRNYEGFAVSCSRSFPHYVFHSSAHQKALPEGNV